MILAPPSKVDEKVAALEGELLEKDARFNRDRFVYVSTIGTLIAVLVGCVAPAYVFFVVLAILLAVFIGLAHWLDFPWVITYFDKIFEAVVQRINGQKKEKGTEYEPLSPVFPEDGSPTPSLPEEGSATEGRTDGPSPTFTT